MNTDTECVKERIMLSREYERMSSNLEGMISVSDALDEIIVKLIGMPANTFSTNEEVTVKAVCTDGLFHEIANANRNQNTQIEYIIERIKQINDAI